MNPASSPTSGGSSSVRRARSRTDLSATGAPAREATTAAERLGIELADEMRRRWRTGERPAAEEFLALHPDLWQQPQAAVDLIYEEYCAREAAGDAGAEQDLLRRFPQWGGPLRVMLECHHRVLQSEDEQARFPEAGERAGDFHLLAELARGARGRVFLATQAGLGNRPVVLKITPLDGAEHLSLARLQHTNIVPLYSVCDDADRRIRVLCMPFFGRATLAWLFHSLADVSLAARTGAHVLTAIDRAGDVPLTPPTDRMSWPPQSSGAACHMLARVSYVQAICWVAASLADALHFAHERGVVHLDLKPSNVLLTTDGQPMLLDFHLAREPIRSHGPPPDNVGGTPSYMSPEQRSAMRSIEDGRHPDVTVDGRADLYSLGAIMYEALGGQLPVRSDSPALARLNPQVSVGLSDVVARCLARRAEDRYPDALHLADDLRHHLNDQPLAGVPERSLAERWAKWRRRRPGALRAVALIAVIASTIAVALAVMAANFRDRREQAELALRDGQRQVTDQHYVDAMQTFERGLTLAQPLPFQDDLRRRINAQLMSARRLNLAKQLHQLANEVRLLFATDSIPSDLVHSLAGRCAALWQKRNIIADFLEPTRDDDLAADLQDIAIFSAGLRLRLSATSDPETGRHEASGLLDEAQAMFGQSSVIELARQTYHLTLQAPATSSAPSVSGKSRSAREHYVLGRAFLATGKLAQAAEELAAAVRLEPAGRWPNFYCGLCAYRTGHYDEAIAASACASEPHPTLLTAFTIGPSPTRPWASRSRRSATTIVP